MKRFSFIALLAVSGNLLALGGSYQGQNQPQNQNYQVDVQQQQRPQQYQSGQIDVQQQPQYKNGQVISSNEPKIGNPAILTQIQDLLKNSHKNYVVTVHIADDVVTLTGSVNSEEDKRGLEDRVRALQGVRGVKNELTVNPNGNQAQTSNPSYNNNMNNGNRR